MLSHFYNYLFPFSCTCTCTLVYILFNSICRSKCCERYLYYISTANQTIFKFIIILYKRKREKSTHLYMEHVGKHGALCVCAKHGRLSIECCWNICSSLSNSGCIITVSVAASAKLFQQLVSFAGKHHLRRCLIQHPSLLLLLFKCRGISRDFLIRIVLAPKTNSQ